MDIAAASRGDSKAGATTEPPLPALAAVVLVCCRALSNVSSPVGVAARFTSDGSTVSLLPLLLLMPPRMALSSLLPLLLLLLSVATKAGVAELVAAAAAAAVAGPKPG